MGNYCFGVDVGGTTVKCGLFRTDGTLLEKWEIPTRVEDGGKNIIGDIGAALLEKMEMVLEVEAVSADGGPKDKEAVDWWISRCQQSVSYTHLRAHET